MFVKQLIAYLAICLTKNTFNMRMIKNYKIIIVLCLFEGLFMSFIFSQDKHGYITKLGTNLFYREVQDANRTVLKMNEIRPITAGMDGLTVTFNFTVNLRLVTKPLKLLSFTNSSESNSYIDFFYDSGTITVRRKYGPGSEYYYDYQLYDPLFTIDSGVVMWEIYIFFTGYFIWIETRDTRKVANNRYHAPLFIGIDSPRFKFMDNFLNRSSSAILIFGDPNPSTVFTMPEEIGVYEFKYSDLRSTLNNEFSRDN